MSEISAPARVRPAHWSGALIGMTIVGMIVMGVFAINLPAYLLMTLPAILGIMVWFWSGEPGIPALPMVSFLYWIYYALPLMRTALDMYETDEILRASASVGAFLLAASLASWPFLAGLRRRASRDDAVLIAETHVVQIIYIGLASGVAYYFAAASGLLAWAGSAVGIVRAIMLTAAAVSCYLIGYGRASRLLVGDRWVLACAGMAALITLALSNLLLIGGAIYMLAATLGFVVTAKRVPWVALGVAFVVLSLLQAGKYKARDVYWEPHTQSLRDSSVGQVPRMMMNWLASGIETIEAGRSTPSDETGTLLERASLLHMVLLVERVTPGFIPYLDGATYRALPTIVIPRVIDPSKPDSQAGLNLLSIRYGLQVREATASTTIAWGLVSEAYANYGYAAIPVVGALIGILCGLIMRWSARAAPLSLRMFIAIAVAIGLFDVEMDFSYLVITIGQSVVAVTLFAAVAHLMRRVRQRGPASALGEAGPEDGAASDVRSP
ncbi:MAG TPA: hypothetical protein VMF53_01900 [Alphaproteobacteria bacterium]|nr:hypothetical protein [Alphaproteobacteria bacterium]